MIEIFGSFPEWMQGMIEESFEVSAAMRQANNSASTPNGGLDEFKKEVSEDEIPF